MAYREVSVIEIREVLRLWLRGEGLRSVARLTSADRKTVRRYVEAAQAAGLARDGNEGQLADELLAAVVEEVRPARPRGHGAGWERCEAERDRIKAWVKQDLTVVRFRWSEARTAETATCSGSVGRPCRRFAPPRNNAYDLRKRAP
jgi:hypothetical protein